MSDELRERLEAIFKYAYKEQNSLSDYHLSFSNEGHRKSEYIADDLRRLERAGQLQTEKLGYLSIGGSDGSEAEQIMRSTDIASAVLIEIGDDAAERARAKSTDLRSTDKNLVVMQGDATQRIDDALDLLERWCAEGKISGLVCSAQAVLHELPSRSPGFKLSTFLGKLFRHSGWKTCAFYSREPCSPKGWPSEVRIRIPSISGSDLARLAKYVRDRLKMNGEPEVLASNWVVLPAPLAIETLHKLLRGNSIGRIGYELGEQLTSFNPLDAKLHLESMVEGMKVTVQQIITTGFKSALLDHSVEYRGAASEPLPIPHTHSELIGIKTDKINFDYAPHKTKNRQQAIESSVRINNPFKGDISDDELGKWLAQFPQPDRPIVSKLLDRFTYIDNRQLTTLAQKLHEHVMNSLGEAGHTALFVPFGGPAKSGYLVAYYYRVRNKIPLDRFIDYDSLGNNLLCGNRPIVFLDDLLATGHQAVKEWSQLDRKYESLKNRRIVLATLVGHIAGIRYVVERTPIESCVALELSDRDEPLSGNSQLFPDEEERHRARNILAEHGKRLTPRGPFGYGGAGLLLAFEHSTPDNTFPIFWANTDGWIPLIHRGGSSRLIAP